MSEHQKKVRNALDRVADALVEEILNSSDEQLMAEAMKDGIDPDKLSSDFKEIFERAYIEARNSSIARCKREVCEAGRLNAQVVCIIPESPGKSRKPKVDEGLKLTKNRLLVAG